MKIPPMATMIKEVYDALLEAGASDEKAGKAAEAVASYDSRFNKIESDLHLLKWMVGFNLVFTMSMLWKVFG